MADDDDLRFGDLEENEEQDGVSHGGGPIDGLIDLAIQLIILAVVLFVFYKMIEAMLPLL